MLAWQAQVDAVISGRVDATMVQIDVWQKNSKNAEESKIIAKLEKLPSPIIIVKKPLEEAFKKEFTSLLQKSSPLHCSLGSFPIRKSDWKSFTQILKRR